MIHISTADAIRTLRREFGDLTNGQQSLAIARALNRTIRSARTSASKEIRSVWKIRAKDIKAAQRIKPAKRSALEAAMITTGRPIPLLAFGARQTKKGISVNIAGQRKYFPGAFRATMRSGHVGIFARGVYGGNKFAWRKTRLNKWPQSDSPITELRSLSVPVATRQDVVLRHLSRKVEQDFPKRLTHELLNIRRTNTDAGGGE